MTKIEFLQSLAKGWFGNSQQHSIQAQILKQRGFNKLGDKIMAAANPKVELCAFKDGKWVRVAGKLVNDDSKEVKEKMLEKMPSLKGMYSADDDNMQMLYFKDAVATFCSFTEAPEQINF